MQTRRVVLLVAASVVAFTTLGSGQTSRAKVTVSSQPLYAGRIDPKLFGNFMELLDDLVPGMWAEMLNDRSFEGVTRPANWVYAVVRPRAVLVPFTITNIGGAVSIDPVGGPRNAFKRAVV